MPPRRATGRLNRRPGSTERTRHYLPQPPLRLTLCACPLGQQPSRSRRIHLATVISPLSPCSLLGLLFLLATLAPFRAGWAQSRPQTEARLSELRTLIQQDEARLSTALTEEETLLEKKTNLDRQITLRQELVATYRHQLGRLALERDSLRQSLDGMDEELEALKLQYRRRARACLQTRTSSRPRPDPLGALHQPDADPCPLPQPVCQPAAEQASRYRRNHRDLKGATSAAPDVGGTHADLAGRIPARAAQPESPSERP